MVCVALEGKRYKPVSNPQPRDAPLCFVLLLRQDTDLVPLALYSRTLRAATPLRLYMVLTPSTKTSHAVHLPWPCSIHAGAHML